MSKLKSGWVLLAATIGITTCLSNAAFAADCGLPVAAPKYEGNEGWKWKNDKGREWENRVIGVEGETTAIRWPTAIAYYNKAWVIERVKRDSGEVVDKQGAGSFTDIGQKVLDFPLELGKQWRWSFMDKPSGGQLGLVTYTHWVKVAACEDVQTPAGTYPALKIEVNQRSDASSSRNGTYYLWWAPSVKQIIKRQYVSSLYWGDKVTDYELIWSGKTDPEGTAQQEARTLFYDKPAPATPPPTPATPTRPAPPVVAQPTPAPVPAPPAVATPAPPTPPAPVIVAPAPPPPPPRAERPTYTLGEKWIRDDGVYELIRIENDRYIFSAGPGKEVHLSKDLGVANSGGDVFDPPLPLAPSSLLDPENDFLQPLGR